MDVAVNGPRSNGDGSSEFLFVRHGQTEPNALGLRCGGDLDVELTSLGCEQAWSLGLRLRREGWQPSLILCSGLIRVRQTAMILAGMLGAIELVSDRLLDERRLGSWNRTPILETEEALKRGDTPPGGESESDFRQRMEAASRLILSHRQRRPLVVSSKGVARLLHNVLGGSGRLQVGNAELVRFHLRPGPQGALQVEVLRPWSSAEPAGD